MSAAEVAVRARDHGRRLAWRRRHVRPGHTDELRLPHRARPFASRLSPGVRSAVPPAAARALVEAADHLLGGSGEILGVPRHDLAAPDWFFDPVTGRRAPQVRYAFDVDHRAEEVTGNVKQVWELSRHHHLTTLAAAWWVSGDDRYAEAVARQLHDWWQENPNLSGIHWTSGIELGIRLVAWAWIRRLLDGWPPVADLFEGNALAVHQLRWHQQYLCAFRSFGSSANNHAVAEAAGLLVASCAFPWFEESRRWRNQALAAFERELERNTFPSGVNRELASDYHAFVAELGLVAAVEAGAAGLAIGAETWARLCRMVDVAAALVDEGLRGPRQGDGDDGRTLVLDAPASNRWPSLLDAGAALFGALPWWPRIPGGDVRSTLLAALAGGTQPAGERPRSRPSHFGDAGITVLRTLAGERPEIWCRCDAGPHGFLSIAAHAHADALSLELRHGGTDVLADPGCYCYHGERRWRDYFRSTVAHNTLEIDDTDQSEIGGPFLWLTSATSRLLSVTVDAAGGVQRWSGEHDGYLRLDPPARHRRTVSLDPTGGRLEIVDDMESDGRHRCRLAFHLGPSVQAVVEGTSAALDWPVADGCGRSAAVVTLPAGLRWSVHRGEREPIMGWYAPRFGQKEPAPTLLGTGTWEPGSGQLVTTIEFGKNGQSALPSG